jgi:hypothetical protein
MPMKTQESHIILEHWGQVRTEFMNADTTVQYMFSRFTGRKQN